MRFEQPSTFLILCCTMSWMAWRAGPRYCRGSKWSGCRARYSRTAAVIARRRSVSMLILQTPDWLARRSISSGTPWAPLIFPPNSLHLATNSGRTVEAPWSTRGKFGSRRVIVSRRSKSS